MAMREDWADGRLVKRWNETNKRVETMDNGVVSSWVPMTSTESAAADAFLSSRTAITNRDELRTRARSALTANAAYLAIQAPTNAQNVAQIQRLTRQVNALIRLEIDDLGTITGT